MKIGDVVKFNENHKWCGCLEIIREVKDCKENGVRYMVGVPVPMKGTDFIFVMDNEEALEYIGKAVLVLKDEED